MTYEEFREKCDKLRLTDYAVSKLTGVSKATISQWKNGNTKLSDSVRNKINYLLENYDPDKYFQMPPYLSDEPWSSLSTNNEPSKPVVRFDSYTVMLDDGIPIEITVDDYKKLKSDTAIYAHAWLKAHGIL